MGIDINRFWTVVISSVPLFNFQASPVEKIYEQKESNRLRIEISEEDFRIVLAFCEEALFVDGSDYFNNLNPHAELVKINFDEFRTVSIPQQNLKTLFLSGGLFCRSPPSDHFLSM